MINTTKTAWIKFTGVIIASAFVTSVVHADAERERVPGCH